MRADRALHQRGLARSRSHAQELIRAGAVLLNGAALTKPSVEVAETDVVEVSGTANRYVSRAAHKLLGALDACRGRGLDPRGLSALDAGASTGGFTQVLLEAGASHVIAMDVGHDQLDASLRADARVTTVEGVNVRDLDASSPGAGVDLVVADLSFISLTVVLPALVAFARADAEFLLMVKPQFEVGRGGLSGRGVVTDPRLRRDAVRRVADAMVAQGLAIHHVSRSALPGPQGNVEYFIWSSGSWQARGHARSDRPVLEGAALAACVTAVVEEEKR